VPDLLLPPAFFRPGDTITWTVTLPDYPAADGYQLRYAFVSTTEQHLVPLAGEPGEATVTDAGSGVWTVTVNGSGDDSNSPNTQDWGVGDYAWTEYVNKSDNVGRVTLRSGTLVVKPALDGAGAGSGYEHRTWAKRCLDAIEATIEGRADHDQLSYSIGGRSLARMSLDELLRARGKFRRLVLKEQRAERVRRGWPTRNTVKVRLG